MSQVICASPSTRPAGIQIAVYLLTLFIIIILARMARTSAASASPGQFLVISTVDVHGGVLTLPHALATVCGRSPPRFGQLHLNASVPPFTGRPKGLAY
jgi:hypothetical protein